MKDIKGKKIAVLCDSVEKIKKMMIAVGKEDYVNDAERRYERLGKNVCQSVDDENHLGWADKDFYSSYGYQIITFEEFIEEDKPQHSTEEILSWIIKNNDTGKYGDVFGADYLFDDLVVMFTPSEIVQLVSEQLDKEKLITISKSDYDKITTDYLNKLYPNGWKVEK